MSAIVSAIQPAIRSVIGSALTISSVDLTPEQLIMAMFASGAKGAWYERSNVASLYQDATGSLLGAAGLPIGLGLDRSQGLTRGLNLAVNGGFDVDANWTKGVSWTIAGGRAIRSSNAAGSLISQAYALVAGKTYEITFDYYNVNGTCRAVLRGGTSVFGVELIGTNSTGQYRTIVTAATGNTTFDITASTASFTGEFDNYSIREVLGNHQRQATPGARPTYQAGPPRAVFDGVDDVLNTTFATALGVSCTVGRTVPGTGAVITSGVNIGTSFADNVTASALVIIDRMLTASEIAALTAYLSQQALL